MLVVAQRPRCASDQFAASNKLVLDEIVRSMRIQFVNHAPINENFKTHRAICNQHYNKLCFSAPTAVWRDGSEAHGNDSELHHKWRRRIGRRNESFPQGDVVDGL